MNYLGENSARELIRLTKNEIATKGGGTIDVDLEGANEGEANLVNADTLNNKLESELSVYNSELLDNYTLADILLLAHPVHSLYISKSPTDPSTLFGGTWQRIKDMFILAAGDTYEADTTGGKATHTLTVDEMPSHTHEMNYPTQNGDVWGVYGGGGHGGWGLHVSGTNNNYGRHSNKNTGGSQPHNNMPPYTTRYVWERIA